jgi:hypothetical protein
MTGAQKTDTGVVRRLVGRTLVLAARSKTLTKRRLLDTNCRGERSVTESTTHGPNDSDFPRGNSDLDHFDHPN